MCPLSVMVVYSMRATQFYPLSSDWQIILPGIVSIFDGCNLMSYFKIKLFRVLLSSSIAAAFPALAACGIVRFGSLRKIPSLSTTLGI